MNDVVIRWWKSSGWGSWGAFPLIRRVITSVKKIAEMLELSLTRSFTGLDFRHVKVDYGCSTLVIHHQIVGTNIVMANTGLVYFPHRCYERFPDKL